MKSLSSPDGDARSRLSHSLRPTHIACGIAAALSAAVAVPAWAQTVLPAVDVRAGRDPVVPPTSEAATRTDTPIEQVPQSVISVGRRLIEDQGATSVAEALRNVSNVQTLDPRDLNNGTLRVRGFEAAPLVDGIAVPGYFNTLETLSAVERIDVVKGPAGTLFGGSQAVGGGGFVGGLVAITTRSPVAESLTTLSLRGGAPGIAGAAIDLNRPLGPTSGVRLVADVQRQGSETDRVSFDRISLFPSFAWRPDADRELVVRMRWSDVSTPDYAGLPARGTVVPAGYTIRRSTFLGAEGLPDTTTRTRGIQMQWRQRLDATWSWALTAGYLEAELDQRGVFPFPFAFASAGAGPVLTLAGARLKNTFRSAVLQPSVTARFSTGPIEHRLIAGMDLDRTRDVAFLRFSPGFGVLGFADVTNPVLPGWAEPDTTGTPDQRNRYRSEAVYLQDQMTIGENWHVLASIRHTRIRVDDVNANAGVNNRSSNDITTGRFGVVYRFTPHVSAFAGWGEGVRIPTFAILPTPPRPETSAQKEIGIRLTRLAGVNATLALFDLELRDAVVGDPANPGQSLQIGRQASRGVDLDVHWQATPEWAVLANASRQNARILDDPQLAGRQLFNTPRTSGRLAVRWDGRDAAWRGWGAGFGATYHDRLPGDAENNFFTPAATVFDAQVSYSVGSMRFAIVANNLTDRRYFLPSAYFGGGQVLPSLRRSVFLTASFAL